MKPTKKFYTKIENLILEEISPDLLVDLVTYYVVLKGNGGENNPTIEDFLKIKIQNLPQTLYTFGMSPKEIHFRMKKFKYLRWIDGELYLVVPVSVLEKIKM